MKCKCDMRTKLVGDGCQVCNPELTDPSKESLAVIAALNRTWANRYGHVLFRLGDRKKFAAVIDRTLKAARV